MESYDVYKEIAGRTQGDIYVGVVGPVRTGKSTFIKKFMDLLVIPNIENEFKKERAKDELPQSAAGKTIMTTEPKFVPNEAVEIIIDDNINFRVRLIDCVGYLVSEALGYFENNAPRMVSTPWHEEQIPFEEAAEIGTKKVISEHSTIGLVVLTDGSICDIPREEYLEAEERVIRELKSINKPFIIVLNSTRPSDGGTINLREELEEKYNVPVMSLNCAHLNIKDINTIMEKLLFEFPICEIGVNMPKWLENLDNDHWLRIDLINAVKNSYKGISKIREVKSTISNFDDCEYMKKVYIDRINAGDGSVLVEVDLIDGLFYKILEETTGVEIEGEHKLIGLIKNLVNTKKEFEKVQFALHEVQEKGYGIVTPIMEEISLHEPEIIKQGNRFGVRLRANAPSIHMIRADIETEIAPLVGTEKQSEELVTYLLKEFEDSPGRIWKSNIFGKSLHELVSEGLNNKLHKMPEDARLKLRDTLQRIINEGSGGLICIII